IQARGALKQELVRHLRSRRRIRRSRHASVHGHSQGRIVDAFSIRERRAEVEDRAIPGHWEGGLLRGTRNSHVATLVERHSRFCLLVLRSPVSYRRSIRDQIVCESNRNCLLDSTWAASSISNMLCSSMLRFIIRNLLRRHICPLLSLFSSVCLLDCAP